MPEIITRAQASEAGLTRYYTGRPCHCGHLAERYASNNQCVECMRLYYLHQRKGKESANRPNRPDPWPWPESEIWSCRLAVEFSHLLHSVRMVA
jgi:hypothetical protein